MRHRFVSRGDRPARRRAGRAQRISGQSETAIVLSPFEIIAENDSYDATNTMGVTGTNREIRRLPLSMDAYTRTFIDEIGATDVTSVMLMAPNIEFRSDSGPGSAPNGVDQFRIRGLFSRKSDAATASSTSPAPTSSAPSG